MFKQGAETVHDGEHTNHSRRHDRHRRGGYHRDNIDGVVPFLGEKVSPGYAGFEFQGCNLFSQQLVDALHSVDGLIKVEDYLGNDAELVTLERAQFTAELMGVFLDEGHGLLHAVLREDGNVYMRYAQVRRHAHFAHGYERAAQRARVTEKNIAHVLLNEAGDLVLTGGFHKVIYNFTTYDVRMSVVLSKTRERRRVSFPYFVHCQLSIRL